MCCVKRNGRRVLARLFIAFGLLAVSSHCKQPDREPKQEAQQALADQSQTREPNTPKQSGPASAESESLVEKQRIEGYEVLFDRTSKFGRVLVGDHDGKRCMAIGSFFRGLQGCMSLEHPQAPVHKYAELFPIGLTFMPHPKRVLMIGLGCGEVTRMLLPALPELHLDVVELDPLIIEAAARHFGVVTTDRLAIHEAEGRAFLEASNAQWDVVMLDAFDGDYQPFSLTTREFMELVKGHLRPGGVVVANLWGNSRKRLSAQLKTMAQVFPALYTFRNPASETVMVVASSDASVKDLKEILGGAASLQDVASADLRLTEMAGYYVPIGDYQFEDAPILQDSQNETSATLGSQD